MANWRKELSLPGLLSLVSKQFQHIADPMTRERKIPLKDCLLSGLAIFNLKFPSLLQFDGAKNEPQTQSNLKSLFGIEQIPSDTYLRERLDAVAPNAIRPVFKALFAKLQRGKALEQFTYLDDHYRLSVDGTGYFSSHQVHCPQCCAKRHRSGEITYYHQLLGAALVHPNHSHVLPFAPEPISKQDGARKNDCERNAAKRLLSELRREHPHLKLIVVEDALASNGPHIALLRDLDMRFILGAKPKDHTFLFDWVANSSTQWHEQLEDDGTIHRFQFINGVPLNDANFDCEVVISANSSLNQSLFGSITLQ